MHNMAINIFTIKTSQLQHVSILEKWSSGKNQTNIYETWITLK